MIFSLVANILAFSVGLSMVRSYTPLYPSVFSAVLLSFIGHIIGTFFYSFLPTDSIGQYFNLASPYFLKEEGTTGLIKNITWYVRYIFTDDSLLATFYFFSPFSFLGSILWYVLYLKISINFRKIHVYRKWQPFLIMCWPSFLFFTSGIAKDPIIFFIIPLFFITIHNVINKQSSPTLNIFMIILSAISVSLLRPYLLMIALIAFLFYKSKSKISLEGFLFRAAGIALTVMCIIWVLHTQGNMESIDAESITNRITSQQNSQARGTHFTIPSDNPIVRITLLPYSFVMNLIFPLFYLAGNSVGILASLENMLLFYIIFDLIKNRKIIKLIFKEVKMTKYLFYFFTFGMLFMASVNTNLGLSTRQKSMYVPCILVLYCLLSDKKNI